MDKKNGTAKGGWKNMKITSESRKCLMTGDEAVSLAAIHAGCRFYAGYPITPASEIMDGFAKSNKKLFENSGGIFIQMEDEIASICAIIGASLGGKKVMTATSGPGFSLMMEGISYAKAIEAPCVIVDVMRVGPSTGQATRPAAQDIMQARWGHHGDGEIIALCPASVQEAYNLTIHAFNLAEMYRVPVIILMDGFIGHLVESITIPEEIKVFDRKKNDKKPIFGPYSGFSIPNMPEFGTSKELLVTGTIHNKYGERCAADPEIADKSIDYFCSKVEKNEQKIRKLVGFNEFFTDGADTLLISYGAVSRSALWAVKEIHRLDKESAIGLLDLKVLWPFPDELIQEYAKECSCFVVPEMNMGQYVREVQRFKPKELVFRYNEVRGESIHPLRILKFIQKGGF